MSGAMILNGRNPEGCRISETTIDGVPVAEWERRQEPRRNWTGVCIGIAALLYGISLLLLGW